MKSTVMENMKATVSRYGDKVALKEKKEGGWRDTTWKEYYSEVRTTARAFMALGLETERAVCILGENSKKWFLGNLAGIFAGGIPCGIYPTNSPEQCLYLAENSRANIIVVENAAQLAKIKKIKSALPDLKAVVLMNGKDDDEGIHPWESLPAIASRISESTLDERIDEQSPDDCCTLIYTSGTTGNPKGVMISHDNITWTSGQLINTNHGNHEDHILSYLPLSHIAEQIISLHAPILVGSTTWFAESMEKIGENLKEARPTVFAGVPRVWEKIQSKILAADAGNSWLKRKIFSLARQEGLNAGYAFSEGRQKPFLYDFFDKAVYSKIKAELGLDRCRMFVTTAAPISFQTLEFFISIGIPMTEVYGMSECTGPAVVSVPKPKRFKIGWAGPAMAGTELKLAPDGEILLRGRHVFMGYFRNEAATKEAITPDGWLHTGDIGEMDHEGFVKITDRKKELIITSGGENIAPQVLEGKLRAISSISQVVVIGDHKNYLTALITLDSDMLAQEAKAAGSPARTISEASQCPIFRNHMERQIDAVNKSLARVQTIKKFVILPENFSVEGGELTHTMKIKRRIIHQKYAGEIDHMYSSNS